jgi:hypothetical protein
MLRKTYARVTVVSLLGLLILLGALRAGEEEPFLVADFETEEALEAVFTLNSESERFAGEFESGAHALRWRVGAGFEPATLSFGVTAHDIRGFASLAWRWRSEAPVPIKLYVEFATEEGSLICGLPAPGRTWTELAVPIPDMREVGPFDPEKVEWIQIICFRPQPFNLEIDDVRLVPGSGGWRGGGASDAPTYTIADFEGAMAGTQFYASECRAELAETGERGGGHALRWIQKPAADGGWLTFDHLPADLSPYRRVTFRVRKMEGYPKGLYVRFSGGDGLLEADLTEPGGEWEEVTFWLPEMRIREGFDPKDEPFFRLVCFETAGFVIEVDDIVLHRGGDGWRYSARERAAMGIDLTAPVYRVADFERESAMLGVYVEGSEAERHALRKGRPEEGCVLRWRADRSGREARMSLRNIPEDIRDYRLLRLRARIDRKQDKAVDVRIRSFEGGIEGKLEGLGRKWRTFEFPLPKMVQWGEFDPKDVLCLRFVYEGGKGFELDLDDIELVKGAGGWAKTKEQELADVFGEDRARKVREIETDHFTIWTDSAAAKRKFPKALEKTYDFACEALGIEGFEGKLPVYIFQNSNLYADFCVRQGWDRASAEGTAGHACQTYFATYYQAPESATVTHELTHSIFQRALGDGGGSWFQEGVAVYVEELWQKRSVAEMVAPRLRSGEFIPLAQLMATDRLASEHDARGGAGTAWALYNQAGAFFEFLLRGPFAKMRPGAIRALAVLDEDRGDVVEEVEKILGASIGEIEELWLEWGKDPPKPKRR